MADESFFPTNPSPYQCFEQFLPIEFIDKIAEWTTMKLTYMCTRYNVLGVFAIWFIYGLVTLPSINLLFTLGIETVRQRLKD